VHPQGELTMPWGAALAVAGTVAGAAISSNATKSAAQTQANATNAANQTELDMYNQTRSDNAPALSARNDALTRLESILGLDGSSTSGINSSQITSDPGYQFGLQQGQRQLSLSANARGMRDSGAALKAAAQYGNDYATTKYDDAYNRQVNALQSVAGLGQSATNSAAGTSTATAVSANTTAAGNASAASTLSQGNTWANAANQLAGWYKTYSTTPSTPTTTSTNSLYGGIGSGYNDQNGSDIGW